MIDSHVHLYTARQNMALAWMTDDSPLRGNFRVDEYLKDSEGQAVDGIIFLEVDRIQSEGNWAEPIKEYEYISRVILNRLYEDNDEGTSGICPGKRDKSIVLGMIPWAPISEGVEAVEKYYSMLVDANPEGISFIKGFRYLVQDKPQGTMLKPQFGESLRWLANKELVFDLGIDVRSGGLWQLEETEKMLQMAPETVYIINHMAKPDLRIPPSEIVHHENFIKWAEFMEIFSKFKTFVKLSGAFSELEHNLDYSRGTEAYDRAIQACTVYCEVIFKYFGPSRVMWGSDWPVCTVGGGKNALANWNDITGDIMGILKLTEDEKEMVYSGTALNAYRLNY
ncbi:hypothetical protein V1511DRAFT_499830 [Dipodascopsis uninucleata]